MVISKNRKKANEKVEVGRQYSVEEAAALIKQLNTSKFNCSIDIHLRLGIDPRKADQALRGTVSLPHGTGKEKTVLVLCPPELEKEAQEAGADHVGLEDYVQKIEQGWVDIDVVIAAPQVMPKIAKLGRTLGPRNLMPNPKSGTVTPDVASAVKEVKKGKISFRVDKFGIIHSPVGRVNFSAEQIQENAQELINIISRMKPSTAKGTYFISAYLACTMGPSVQLDTKTFSSN